MVKFFSLGATSSIPKRDTEDKMKMAHRVPGALEDIDRAMKELRGIRDSIEKTEAKIRRREEEGRWWFNSFSDTLTLIIAFFTGSLEKAKENILEDLKEDLRHLLDQADSIRGNADAAKALLGRFKEIIGRAIKAYEERETKLFINNKGNQYDVKLRP
jgi:hypothetical protein